MLRNIAAVVVGLIVGMVVNMALVVLNIAIHPMPEGVSFTDPDPEGMKLYMSTLPLKAYLIVIAAHLGQAFVGGWIGALISKNKPMIVAMIIGVFSMTGGIFNMISMDLPSWMWVEMPLYLAVAWIAATLEIKRRG